MSWTLEAARAGFESHAAEWDALNAAHGNHVLLDSRFVASLVRHFATDATLLGVSTAPDARGVALVEPSRLGFASTFQPSQSPLGLIVLESPERALALAAELLRALPGFALGLSVLQQDPTCTQFPSEGLAGAAERLDYIDTGRVTLSGTYQQYWDGRGKNLRHNLGRQRRRLAEDGKTLGLRVTRDPGRVADCVSTYARLEGSGWKASSGTAVAQDTAQGAFYREILDTFLARGEGGVYELVLDGRVIASDLCLERGDTMVILKTAYDAGIEGLSPGLLLHQEIFEQCYAEGRVRVVEFYGRARDWHTKWTQDFRRMYHVNLYRAPWVARARSIARWMRSRLSAGSANTPSAPESAVAFPNH